jgi:hypothetical protein
MLRITAPICFLSLALMSSVARRRRISSTSRTRVTRPLDLQVSQLDRSSRQDALLRLELEVNP